MIDLKYIDAVKPHPGSFNDIEITPEGDIATISGYERVKQDIVKILMTEMGMMPYPNYGSNLNTIPNTSAYDPTLLDSVANEVISSVNYLVLAEESPDPTEQISEITTLDVSVNTNVKIALSVKTKDNETLPLGFSL